jgi:WD40 repeat protein
MMDFSSDNHSLEMKHDERMTCVAFSPDGLSIFAGDQNGSVYAWDVATGALHWHHPPDKGHGIPGHTGGTNAVATSPDGKVIASAGDDGHVKAWDAATGALVADVEMATAGRPYVPWPDTDPDRVWTFPYTNAPRAPRTWFSVYSLAFSPDGRWLTCGMGATNDVLDAILAVDTRTWTALSVVEYVDKRRPNPRNPKEIWSTYEKVQVLDFSPDSRLLASSGVEGVRLYKIGTEEWRVGDVVGYDFYHDTICNYYTAYKFRARFVNNTTLAILLEGGIVQGIELGKGKDKGEICFVVDTRREGNEFDHDDALAASPDGRWLAVGGKDGLAVVALVGKRS